MRFYTSTIFVLVFTSQWAWAIEKEVQVVRNATPIYSDASLQSPVLTTAKQGQVLKVLEEKAGFYLLKTKSGKAMWVESTKVSDWNPQAAADELEEVPASNPRKQASSNHYPRFTFDIGGAAGANIFGSYYELQVGLNTFFNSWFIWRNAPFYRFFGAYSAFGWDSSLRGQVAIPVTSFTPTLMAGVGYRFITYGGNAPFIEAGVGIRTGHVHLNVTGKYLLNNWIDSTTSNQFLYAIGISGGGSF